MLQEGLWVAKNLQSVHFETSDLLDCHVQELVSYLSLSLGRHEGSLNVFGIQTIVLAEISDVYLWIEIGVKDHLAKRLTFEYDPQLLLHYRWFLDLFFDRRSWCLNED